MKDTGIIKGEPTKENGLIPVELGDGTRVYAQWIPNSEPVVGQAVDIERTATGSMLATAKNSHNFNQLFQQSGLQKYAQRASWDVDFANGKIWNEPLGKPKKKITWAFVAKPFPFVNGDYNEDFVKGVLYYVTDLGVTKITVPDPNLFENFGQPTSSVGTKVSFFVDTDDDNLVGFWVGYGRHIVAYYDSEGTLLSFFNLENQPPLTANTFSGFNAYTGLKNIRLTVAYGGGFLPNSGLFFYVLNVSSLSELGFQEWYADFSQLKFFKTQESLISPNGNNIEKQVLIFNGTQSGKLISLDRFFGEPDINNSRELLGYQAYYFDGVQYHPIKSTPGFHVAYTSQISDTFLLRSGPLTVVGFTSILSNFNMSSLIGYNICKVEKVTDGYLKYKGTITNIINIEHDTYQVTASFTEPENISYDYGFLSSIVHDVNYTGNSGQGEETVTVLYSDNGSLYDIEKGNINTYPLSDGGLQFRHSTFDYIFEQPNHTLWWGDYFYRNSPIYIQTDDPFAEFVTEVFALTFSESEGLYKFENVEVESQEISLSGVASLNSYVLAPIYITEKLYEESSG